MNVEHADAASPLYGIVDNSTMVLTGHSFGSAVILDAIQETCEFPLCRPEDSTFTLPDEVKAVALTGINGIPFGNPFDSENRATDNRVPLAIVNGDMDENALYADTKETYEIIENPPKALVFIKGANHYGLCDVNNPGNPNFPEDDKIDGTSTPQNAEPKLNQDISIETNARWVALFLRAHALGDAAALEYVSTTGKYLDRMLKSAMKANSCKIIKWTIKGGIFNYPAFFINLKIIITILSQSSQKTQRMI